MRTTSILVTALAIALSGCASAGGSAPPVCDGKHRRPVNLYGSVLDPAKSPTSAPSPAELGADAPVHPSCGQ